MSLTVNVGYIFAAFIGPLVANWFATLRDNATNNRERIVCDFAKAWFWIVTGVGIHGILSGIKYE